MVDAVSGELGLFVLGFIQSDYVFDTEVLENLKVVFRTVSALLDARSSVDGTHESNKFVRDDPVKVPVFHFLVVLVLFVVEVAELVPAVAYRYFQALQAVVNCAFVGAGVAVTRVSKRSELLLIRRKRLPYYFR